ncbi:hypothetical protein IJU97_06075 [bacterium]|nr:hypothetical protein [bacterium]
MKEKKENYIPKRFVNKDTKTVFTPNCAFTHIATVCSCMACRYSTKGTRLAFLQAWYYYLKVSTPLLKCYFKEEGSYQDGGKLIETYDACIFACELGRIVVFRIKRNGEPLEFIDEDTPIDGFYLTLSQPEDSENGTLRLAKKESQQLLTYLNELIMPTDDRI